MTGCLYRRGKFWWIKVYINGRPLHESTKLTKKSEAKLVLARKVGRIAAGEPLPPRVDRITYDEAVRDLRQYYQTTGERDMRDVEKRLAHLDPFFRGRRVVSIGPALVTEYVAARQAPQPAVNGDAAKTGASNGTINRELSMLGKMFRVAVDNSKALRVPKIPKLREAAPRAGFVERDRFETIIRHLPEPHALGVSICYELAWRYGEVFGLGWRHVDLQRGALRLEAGETKNGEGRTAFLPPNLAEQLRAHRSRVEAVQRKLGRVIPDVFVRLKGKHAGQSIGSFRKTWTKACRAAGAPGLLVHDLRRSGIRNMIRAGVSEHTAMKVSGHLTRSVFDRYDIVDERDLQEAARRIAVLAALPRAGTVTKTVTLGPSGVQSAR